MYHSLTPELHRAAEPGTTSASSLCLRNSPSLGPPPSAHPKAQPGSPTSPTFPSSPALRSAESNVMTPLHCPGIPPPVFPHPVTSPPAPHPTKLTPNAKPTRCTAANIDWGCPSPGPPPAGKTSREPSAEVCWPSGVPASGVQRARVQGPSSCTAAPRGPYPPPGAQTSQTSGPAFPQRLPGLAHLSDCFLLHGRAAAAWV